MKRINEAGTKWFLVTALAGAMIVSGCGGGDDEDDTRSGSDRRDRGDSEEAYLSIEDENIQEGSDKHTLMFSVQLSRSLEEAVTVEYETREGSASDGEDYQRKSGELTISPGNRKGTIEIPILGDEIHEPDEYFEVHLSNSTVAKLSMADSKAAVTIANDDEAPSIAFDQRQTQVAENVGGHRITAELSQVSGYTIEATLELSGTAGIDEDYQIEGPVVLEFAPGEKMASIDLEILQDTIPEGGETITLEMDELKNAVKPRNEESFTAHTVIILGDNALNDTGVVSFSDGVNTGLAVEPASHPGQDASFGRDAGPEPDYDGLAGFSYTKLDADGNPLPSNAPDWHCTLDNTTGLVFENKHVDVSLEIGDQPTRILGSEFRAGNFQYGWRKSDVPRDSGGSEGILETSELRLDTDRPISLRCGYEADTGRRFPMYCHTETYIQEMNHKGVCGFNDWRLPEIEELRSIAGYEPASGNMGPDARFFSNVKASAGVHYFSDTPAADNQASAWCFNYQSGQVRLCKKSNFQNVMAVRSSE